jgi:MerR family copper efflux transcriptional regulator
MNIGKAARASGISAKMIRHYEAIGLISAGRGVNQYRVYTQADVAELRFIRHARDLGFPLQDVKRLLDLWRNRARASAEVKRLALDHVAALEAKAKSLSAKAITALDQAAKVDVDLAAKRIVARTSLPRADVVRAVEEEGFAVKG